MIGRFHGIWVNPGDLAEVRIAFRDSEELDWFVTCRVPLSAQDLERLLNSMELLATDPTSAIGLGIITREDYDQAIKSREEWRRKGGVHRGVN